MPDTIRNSIIISLLLLLCAQVLFLPKLLVALLISLLLLFWLSSKKSYRVPKSINFVAMVMALALIYSQQGTFFGVEAGVAILTSFLFAKVLESHNKRDWIVVFNFALFVSASSFLYSASVWMTLLVILCLLSCLVGLYRLHQLNFNTKPSTLLQDAKQMSKLLLYAAPFFLILFIFFPRLPPLWHMPIANSQATTGLSEQMAPGDIANLSQSSALAFRVVTAMDQLPPQQDLYWRAMVLDHYDGQRWSADPSNQQALMRPRGQALTGLRYQYLAADSKAKWVMGLEYSQPLQRGYYIQQDGAIRVAQSINTPILNLVWLTEPRTQAVYPAILDRNRSYRAEQDQLAQQLAQRLYQASQADTSIYIQQVLAWYEAQGFQYSLSPGRLQGDHIDDFLFRKKIGFCEHYASSFVMLMRYVGIPARVVIGYQGGQAAPDGQSWEVRQQDAHAWSEVWLDGRWQRIDPTAAIAPERIQQGIQNSLWQQQSAFKQQQLAWTSRLHIWSDFVSYQWQSKVVGYDQTKQLQWLGNFGLTTPLRLMIVAIVAIFTLVASLFLLRWLRYYSQQSSYERQLLAFEHSLSADLKKHSFESSAAWLERLSHHVTGELAVFLVELAYYDRHYRYAQHKTQPAPAQLKIMLKKCAFELKIKHKPLS